MANLEEQTTMRRTLTKLVVLAVSMFVFALWVMPPLYDLFCEVTGLNGKTGGQYEAVKAEVDTSRLVKVQFVAVNNEGMPWEFAPKDFAIEVHPGQATTTHFLARNPTTNAMVGQAVPSMVPYNATTYFHKTECFCFNQQTLAAGESAELGLQFIVDQALPKGVNTITLSYSLFDVTEMYPEALERETLENETSEDKAPENKAFEYEAEPDDEQYGLSGYDNNNFLLTATSNQ